MTATTFGPIDRAALAPIGGGVTAAPGFRANGVAAGLKPSGNPDLAVVLADEPCAAAAVTTTNLVKAAPCVVTEEHVRDGRAQAVVINAGNANACTGPEGVEHARRTAAAVADAAAVAPSDVLVLSTGVIGVPLDIDRLVAAVPDAVAGAGPDHGHRAAAAILTTDTVPKSSAYVVEDATGRCTVGGIAKGAGMIEPAMATLLAVITTDAPVAPTLLRQLLRGAVARTFNRISIDACGSTNDTVVVLASGTAEQPPGIGALRSGIEAVCADLARAVVADGEGTSRTASVTVRGAESEAAAERLARAVCASTLFRAALHGADPNWGRILAAMGTCGVVFEPERVTITIGGHTVCRFGVAAAFDRGQVAAAMDRPEVTVDVDLGTGGPGAATLLTADLTPQYVAENAYYTT